MYDVPGYIPHGSEEGRKREDKDEVRRGKRKARAPRWGSMGYRSVRVLLQRPRGQRITRNSRLDLTYTLWCWVLETPSRVETRGYEPCW